MKYKVASNNRGNKFIQVEVIMDNLKNDSVEVMLPRWRPGRYELGNFAKNIRNFKASSNGSPVHFKKLDAHRWKIENGSSNHVQIQYEYYANSYDAGSTYVEDEFMYMNPVNCLLYSEESRNKACSLILDIPDDYLVACSLEWSQKDKNLKAYSFDELADSPFIASPKLLHDEYQVDEHTFHLWFNGECAPDWTKLKKDFSAFTQRQLDVFGDAPFSEYHFLFNILPNQAYHGVEHLSSTVINLGPGFELMSKKLYPELLGVSSHELLHSWNVKSIRPKDWLPYDYQNEDYSELGYLAEGFTTYLGDLYLYQSKVFDFEAYQRELHKLMDRHSYNYGRFNYTVCESSFDSWLDGYSKGIPNRKVSIYTEGALLALCLDCFIIKESKGQNSISQVLNHLYQDFAKNGKGVTEEDIIFSIEQAGYRNASDFFKKYYHQAQDLFDILAEAYLSLGLQLTKKKHGSALNSAYGIFSDDSGKILRVAPGSPAERAGIKEDDKILSINKLSVGENTNQWGNYFHQKGDKSIELHIQKDDEIVLKTLEKGSENYFNEYRLEKIDKPSEEQVLNFKKWSQN